MNSASSADVLAALGRSRELGFLGPTPLERQYEHSLGFVAALDAAGISPPPRVVDLGSGGGLPGLILALSWQESEMTLLDGSTRRCEFLEEEVTILGLEGRVSVQCGRAEELARDPLLRGSFGLVVARSFGAPPVLAECAAGFLGVGSHLLVSEPPQAETGDGTRWPAEGLELLGFSPVVMVENTSRYALMKLVTPCPDRYPRRVGVPSKRPLF